MKKWLVGLISLVVVATVLVGCGSKEGETTKESASASKAEVETLRLGVMPSTDNIPFIIAHQEGFDTDRGVSVELEVFKSALDRDAALSAGELDGVITDLVAVAIYQEGGLDIKVVAAPYDQFDLVSADPAVKTMADLKGKDVIFSERTGTAYAVAMMLEEAGLTVKDITPTEIPQVPVRLEMLGNDQAAAAILPEPFVTMAKAQEMHVVKSTRDLGINPFAIAFKNDVIEEKGDAIHSLFEAYNEAAEFVKTHDKAEYIDLFVAEVGFPETLVDQIEVPDYGKLEQVTEGDITSAFTWAREAGLLEKELTPADVISDVYFK